MQNPHNKIATLIISLVIIVTNIQLSFGGSGRRKHFFSHGSSVAAFGSGESLFSAYNDPASLQYNPSLMVFFTENAISLSRFNLFEGTSYNSGSAAVGLEKKIFLGISVSNLSSGNTETRETVYSPEKIISVNTWDYILSVAGYIDFLSIAYGVNIKYLYYDLYFNKSGTYTVDCGFMKNVNINDILKIKFGISVQNFVSGELKVDSEKDEIPAICRLSSAFILPTYYRFKSKDTINIYADLKYEDGFADFYGGLAYIIADKYALRTGYYPQHFTCGIGIDFYFFTIDYAADFSEINLINRFGLTYRWRFKKSNNLLKEAQDALNKEKISSKKAEQKFKETKCFYNKKEYLRATEMLSDIIMSYPDYESPRHFYKGIVSMMKKTADSRDELDFGKITYARAYNAYYSADYKEALNEWKKYIGFKGTTEEIKEYSKKIDTVLKFIELENKEKELNEQAKKILEDGIEKYNLRKWIQCIKRMEKLENFVSKNNFSKAIEYYSKAKEYIDKSVAELSKSICIEKDVHVQPEEQFEYDEITAEKKYTEGLVLYAQGKYYRAERAWELTLRLNPRHQKAKIALHKLKNSTEN
ncbi:MAG: hypothetical protein LBT18_03155 [Endomicrobium sp.]|jgi:tetratricopeptide (TPR) repeat protein|nr:hypothetical protein [Endomicrobium sp.]